MSLAYNLVANTEETLAALSDEDWNTVMHFFIGSLVAKRSNDLVGILWDRAHKRADESGPARQFQLILRDLDLAIQPRL